MNPPVLDILYAISVIFIWIGLITAVAINLSARHRTRRRYHQLKRANLSKKKGPQS